MLTCCVSKTLWLEYFDQVITLIKNNLSYYFYLDRFRIIFAYIIDVEDTFLTETLYLLPCTIAILILPHL